MPNPKLETYNNKATGDVYDYTDADAQGKLTAILDGTTIDSFSDVESALADKVDVVSGKGLSTNDYDDTEKAKVAGAFPRSEQAVLGATNLFKITEATSTVQNVIFTVDSENNTVSLSGIMAANGTKLLGAFTFKAGVKYHLSGCPAGGGETATDFWLGIYNAGGTAVARDVGNGATLQVNEDITYNIFIRLPANLNTTNMVFKPMISLSADSPFVPYAMTNKELTDTVQGIINAASNAADFAAFKTAIGNL